MATIITRAGKEAPLTNAEVDSNFTNLNTDKAETDGATLTNVDINSGAIDGVTIGGASAGAGTFTTLQANTSLNVDGTVTADGLTVDANSGTDAVSTLRMGTGNSGENKSSINFQNSAGSELFHIDFNNDFTNGASLDFGSDQSTTSLSIERNGDISFYEDTGTTPKLFWDASAESLGIGTTSPAESISTTGNALVGQDTSSTQSLFFRGSAASTGNASITKVFDSELEIKSSLSVATDKDITFYTNANNERMRIDSSGNVGIGTESPDGDLHVFDSASDCNVILETGGSNSQLAFGDAADNFVGKIQYNHPSNFMAFIANGSEAMRIDSSSG